MWQPCPLTGRRNTLLETCHGKSKCHSAHPQDLKMSFSLTDVTCHLVHVMYQYPSSRSPGLLLASRY